MKLELIPLGVSSAVPTGRRHLSSTALRREGRLILFDCGEGTQFRLLDANLKRTRVDTIFLSHLHGDHFYGLFGLLSSMELQGREEPVTLVGPKGFRDPVHRLRTLSGDFRSLEVEYLEVAEDFSGRIFETEEWYVEAEPIEHRVPALGYRYAEKDRAGRIDGERAKELGIEESGQFEALKDGEAVTLSGGRRIEPEEVVGPARPGMRFAYVFDTRPCEAGVRLARNADLLYHEATFTHDLLDRAEATGHSTAREAAEVAREAEADRLLLGHFSARYSDTSELVAEAREVFPEAEAAMELRRYELSAYHEPRPETVSKSQ